MENETTFSRYNLLWMIIGCYLLPVIGLTAYGKFSSDPAVDWNVLTIGLFLTVIGSLAIYWMLVQWESHWHGISKRIEASVDGSNESSESIAESSGHTSSVDQEEYIALSHSLEEAQQVNCQLQEELKNVNEQLVSLSATCEKEKEQTQKAVLALEECRQSSSQQMSQQQIHIRELQETIAEQKSWIEKRQQQVGQLETKVGDLTYEIKTLLKLAESSSTLYSETQTISEPLSAPFSLGVKKADSALQFEKQIQTGEEASVQLKRCLDIAQKITGSHRFNSHMNVFSEATSDSYTFDLRRLCDSLRSENNSAILLYSPKDNQVLFVNNQIKSLTGWSPEKFVQNFNDILLDGSPWKQGVSSLAMRSETQVNLALKTKSGSDIQVQAHLGMIPTGVFRHYTIAVLY